MYRKYTSIVCITICLLVHLFNKHLNDSARVKTIEQRLYTQYIILSRCSDNIILNQHLISYRIVINNVHLCE